jgi:hypothetical protein
MDRPFTYWSFSQIIWLEFSQNILEEPCIMDFRIVLGRTEQENT